MVLQSKLAFIAFDLVFPEGEGSISSHVQRAHVSSTWGVLERGLLLLLVCGLWIGASICPGFFLSGATIARVTL